MRTFKYKELDITEYDVIRVAKYVVEKTKMYVPSDMSFFMSYKSNIEIEFEGKFYYPHKWFGITKYSEEKEKISHNLHWSIAGEEDDYPCVNTFGVNVVNLGNEYLIWELDDIDMYDEFHLTDELPTLDSPIYLMGTKLNDNYGEYLDLISKKKDKNVDLNREFHKPFSFIKVHGFTKEGCFDCTEILIKSSVPYNDNDINVIQRVEIPFEYLDFNVQGRYARGCKLCLTDEKVFKRMYKMVTKNLGI